MRRWCEQALKLRIQGTEIGVANGKSETHQDAETGVLKLEPETKKCNDLIEKQICDRLAQNLRLRDLLVGCARLRDLGRIFRGPFTTLRDCALNLGMFSFGKMLDIG